ncbi:hypothetical protein PIB30_053061 [Stylosanthes scabra]|uniref:Uncharacterized protein n=1 Tax=Stylosanthes scabra TaxID=79078 RepID=A0ABU6WGI4_9FABA|nr:hypothetical protein [Stylosanthes scabra]
MNIFTNNQNRSHIFTSPATAPFDEGRSDVTKKVDLGFPRIRENEGKDRHSRTQTSLVELNRGSILVVKHFGVAIVCVGDERSGKNKRLLDLQEIRVLGLELSRIGLEKGAKPWPEILEFPFLPLQFLPLTLPYGRAVRGARARGRG